MCIRDRVYTVSQDWGNLFFKLSLAEALEEVATSVTEEAWLYNDVVLMNLDSDLYGAESLWFGVMADQGCVGIVA